MPDSLSSEPGSKVSDPQHSQKLLRVLRLFWQEQSFHDALLVVDGEELPVQKNILAAASPYVRTKLNYNPPKEDGSTYRIELQGVSMPIMKQILDYIFSGEITLNEETIQDMVQASDLLLLTDLKDLCCQFLESCITAENCLGIRLFSLHYCLNHVHYVATEFLQTHFGDVALTEEFRELPADRLCEALAMEKLNVGNERHVLEAVVRWFGHDAEDRKVHMKQVMSAVWQQGLDASYLKEQAMGEPLMREVIREYCQQVLGGGPLQGEALLAAFKPRGYSECIVIAGGEDRKTRKPTSETRCMCPLYDSSRQAWITLQPMSAPRLGHGVVTAEGFLFAIGGADEHNTVLDSGEKYDPDTNTWSPIPPMLQPRQNFGVVELDGLIYVLGGETKERELTTVEVFDPHCSAWKMQTSMTMIRKIGPQSGSPPACVSTSGPQTAGVHTHIMKKWSEEALKDCFDTTAWDVFTDSHGEDINSLIDCITDEINFCEENVLPKRTVQCFANNKPWITPEIKALLKDKRGPSDCGTERII
ncbi:gigaxonin isoform X2 [Gymnodraco acuticeps]|uniref:Gigaxonin isoform X2 n=1 Tax=Gymnodraco acuticeps TaxID=8218 RepID=A0A6P8SVS1_GYMAC|nr:gigaxonin isoform X2 [Gymnodraco acuticeps]